MIPFLILLYFILMTFLSFFAAKWIMELVYQEAGVTKQEVEQYQREEHIGGRPQKQTTRALYWLESRSANPARVRKLAHLYSLALLPAILCIPVAFGSSILPFFSPDLKNIILICAMVFLPVYNAVLAIAGVQYKKKKTARNTTEAPAEAGTYASEEADNRVLAERDYPIEESGETVDEAFFPELEAERKFSKRKALLLFGAVLLAAGLAALSAFLVPQLTAAPKTPATVEQVANALTAQGYKPQNADSFDDALVESIAVQSGEFFFEFSTYRDEDSAVRFYDSARSQYEAFVDELQADTTSQKRANYAVYTWRSVETYAVVIRVGSTVLCGQCPAKDDAVLDQILHSIGYL